MKFFNLFACCIPVKGATQSILCDLQRDTFVPIPNTLFFILSKYKNKSIGSIKSMFNNENDESIDEYFNMLVENNYGFFGDEPARFPAIDFSNEIEPDFISNAIVDYAPHLTHDLKKIADDLSALYCEALELRFFYSMDIDRLYKILDEVKLSTLRSVEVVIGDDTSLTIDNIILLHQAHPRLRKITIHSSAQDRMMEHIEIMIIYTTQAITSEKCCGVVSPWYFISNTQTFIEATKYNSCLNRKIAIDKDGNIKNCPSMNLTFGNAAKDSLSSIVDNPEFKSIWKITKDQVEVCRDCEFRYICQDCRAYKKTEANPLSKPLKCNYDPYTGQWA
jgi:SPASM domain peptide maturase of grasp-with-spasm system